MAEKQRFNIDFVGRMGVFAIVSGILVGGSVVATSALGLNFGIDFAGGYEIQVKFAEATSEAQVQSALEPLGLGDARIQRFGAANQNEFLVLIRETGTISDDDKAGIKADYEKLAGGADKLINLAIAESGETVRVEFGGPVEEDAVRDVLSGRGLTIKDVTRSERTDQPEFRFELVSLADQIEDALQGAFGAPEGSDMVRRVEFVGPQVGNQLRNQGILAVLYALGFILIYIAIRFDLAFSPGAVVALVHDVIITVGVFAIFQLEFNLPIIAAILALVGYSLNDTIVVYDRIRENAVRYRGRTLRDLVNTSLNQTLSRTIITSATTLLATVSLLVFGGGIVRDFAIALTVGVLIGTYSSVAVASPVYIVLRERAERRKAASSTAASKSSSTAVA
ncbi:MAG: protein translocase subunit SecF [Myxococcota bacterium]